ncbi:MAG: barstar family protein [Christensenellales bacterium]
MIIGNYIESKQYQKITVSLKDVNTEEDLFKTFYQQLNFPKYFGFNWDALEEFLSQPSFEVNSDIMYIITDCKSCLKNFGNKLIGFFNRLVDDKITDLDTDKYYECVVYIEGIDEYKDLITLITVEEQNFITQNIDNGKEYLQKEDWNKIIRELDSLELQIGYIDNDFDKGINDTGRYIELLIDKIAYADFLILE